MDKYTHGHVLACATPRGRADGAAAPLHRSLAAGPRRRADGVAAPFCHSSAEGPPCQRSRRSSGPPRRACQRPTPPRAGPSRRSSLPRTAACRVSHRRRRLQPSKLGFSIGSGTTRFGDLVVSLKQG